MSSKQAVVCGRVGKCIYTHKYTYILLIYITGWGLILSFRNTWYVVQLYNKDFFLNCSLQRTVSTFKYPCIFFVNHCLLTDWPRVIFLTYTEAYFIPHQLEYYIGILKQNKILSSQRTITHRLKQTSADCGNILHHTQRMMKRTRENLKINIEVQGNMVTQKGFREKWKRKRYMYIV